MTGIIDIHAHILPGIDDGSRDWDESRRMLEESYRQGIRYIIATPHYSRRGLNPDIYDLSEKLKEEARRIAPDFRTGLGQETYYHDGLVENLRDGKALTLEGSQYVLVEFDPQVPYMKMYQAVRKLTMARYIPIIAHVERYACLREDTNMSERLCRAGFIVWELTCTEWITENRKLMRVSNGWLIIWMVLNCMDCCGEMQRM